MGWEIARDRAWSEIGGISSSPRYAVQLLDDEYEADLDSRTVLSRSSGLPADEGIAVLILHYLIGIQKSNGFTPSGEWISFRELKGGISFLPAFQETAIKSLVECLKKCPDALIRNLLEGFGGRMVEGGDAAVELTTFPGIYVRVVMWLGDEDLPPDATMLFDRSLARIYTTEDIAVFLQLIARRITE
jgi:hypothetical protein